MGFEFTRAGSPCIVSLSLEKTAYEEWCRALDVIDRLFEVEQSYYSLFGNYIDLESFFLTFTLKAAVQPSELRSEFDEGLFEINRKLANLFSTFFAYFEYLERRAPGICGRGTPDYAAFKNLLEAERSANSSIPIIVELRNHSQHSGSPADLISLGGKWRLSEADEPTTLVWHTTAFCSKTRFEKSARRKPNSIPGIDPAIDADEDIMPILRKALARLSVFHAEVRELFSGKYTQACSAVSVQLEAYRSLTGVEEKIGFVAREFDDRGETLRAISQLL